MSRPGDEVLLAFLEGRLDEPERSRLLDRMDRDPALAAEIREAARGLEAFNALGEAGPSYSDPGREARRGRRVSPWWAVAASAATLVLSVPVTLQLAGGEASGGGGAVPGDARAVAADVGGMPIDAPPSFVLVLHGRWPDAGQVDAAEARRRAEEYWGWTTSLARSGRLVAAGDLRWEPGERLGPAGTPVSVAGTVVEDPDYLVGMFALRAATYEEALEVARQCPHLRYGGSVSVRRVGSGFVTVPGQGDWSD